jgi:hypothetical protein
MEKRMVDMSGMAGADLLALVTRGKAHDEIRATEGLERRLRKCDVL